jgi:hypothetical protein
MFRKIRNIWNLGNVHIRGPHIVMSRTDAQNGLDFHFKFWAQVKNGKLVPNWKSKATFTLEFVVFFLYLICFAIHTYEHESDTKW